MDTKLSKLVKCVESDDWNGVFRIASKFPNLGDHRSAILDAWSAFQNPSFVRQIGKDPAAMVEAGKKAIRERYNLSGE